MNSYKFHYDRAHRKVSFEENELVMVFWPTPKKGFSQKLLPKWEGPYKIVKRLGEVSYRIEKGNRQFVVHVQRLRKYQPWISSTSSA
jgi:hypothetical protein